LPCTAKATSYNIPGAKVSYDEASLTNRIELPETAVSKGWTLVVNAKEIDPALVVQRAVAKHLQDLLGQPYDTWKAANTPLPPEMDAAFSAAKGFALVEQNLHPYLLGSDTALLYCHNHQNTPETVSVAIGTASPTQLSLRTGDPVGKASTGSGLPEATPVTITVPDDSPGGIVLHSQVPAYHDLSDDLALKATAEASSGNAAGAIDGKIGGYPNDRAQEWTTNGEKEGAWIKLTWSDPVNAQAILLYDRPNPNDQIVAGTLEFDDGTKMDVGALPNDGSLPFKVTFPSKSVRWVKFTATQVSPKTENIGLSEMAVLGAP
jgi:hypothetical protein